LVFHFPQNFMDGGILLLNLPPQPTPGHLLFSVLGIFRDFLRRQMSNFSLTFSPYILWRESLPYLPAFYQRPTLPNKTPHFLLKTPLTLTSPPPCLVSFCVLPNFRSPFDPFVEKNPPFTMVHFLPMNSALCFPPPLRRCLPKSPFPF